MAVMMSAIMQIPKDPWIPSSHTPGDIITWDNKEWLVCHYESNKNQIYLITKDIISTTIFGNNPTYAGSTLASVAATYQSNNMSAAALKRCVDVTVEGVTAKVFVPGRGNMNGGFSWFNGNDHRIAQYQDSNTAYWLSSAYNSDWAWNVGVNGQLEYGYVPGSLLGFRPCVCVQL